MSKQWAALHNHDEFSYQDGLFSPEAWIDAAIKKGVSGIGVTNHGNAGNIIDYYNIGKNKGYPTVLGTEFYAIDDRAIKDSKHRYNHINIFAKNAEGYKNLCILNSISWNEDRFYYKPRIDLEDLKNYNQGLICTSACIAGFLAQNLNESSDDLSEKGYKILDLLLSIFGKDFYLEVLPADTSWSWNKDTGMFEKGDFNLQEKVNKVYQKLSKERDIKIIATTDAHMLDFDHKILQDVQIKNSPGNKGGWCFHETYYLSDYDQTIQLFKEKHPYLFEENKIYEYMDNTLEVLDKCKDLKLDFKPLLPEITKVELIDLIRAKNIINPDLPENKKRLDHEINVLVNNGKIDLTNYFLVLADLVEWCKGNGIMTGPGRGSACGALTVFGLGITKIDPLKHNLSFERFINEARISEGTLPDIDLDVDRINRSRVFGYLKNKYGEDRVSSVGTTSTLQLRSAIKDVFRILAPEVPADQVNKITIGIQKNYDKLSDQDYLLTAIANNAKFKEIVLKNKEIYKVLSNLVGQARQRGTHASALVISPIPLMNIVPMAKIKGDWVTQYTMGNVEKVGLIKFDILGLNTLNNIGDCLELSNIRHSSNLSMEKIINDLDNDKSVFKKFEKCDTHSVFQFNTDVAKYILKRINIKSIGDLSDVTALGRPATLDVDMHNVYIRRENNKEPVSCFHSSVEDVLRNTKGIMLYQEQVMKVFQIIGGFNAIDADNVRRGMAKKKEEVLMAYKDKFIKNAQVIHGDINKNKAELIWTLIEANSGYSFCLSHSIAYACIGYVCQYLKTYFPLEWWCSVLKYEEDNDKLGELYCMLKDILISPDINFSKKHFYINDDKIVMPLNYIMQLGEKAVNDIVENQPYVNLRDFAEKVNKRVVRKDIVINLILANAFSKIEQGSDKDLIKKYYDILGDISDNKKKLNKEYEDKYLHLTRFDLIKMKNKVLPGCTINYLDLFKDRFTETLVKHIKVKNMTNKKEILTGGIISKVTLNLTKNQETYARVIIEDGDSSASLLLWPEAYRKYKDNLLIDKFLIVDGKVNVFNDSHSIIVSDMKFIEI